MLSLRVRKTLTAPSGDQFRLEAEFEAPVGVTILFGPSGSGKSTLLDCLAGLERPEAGYIAVGNDVFFDDARRIDLPVRARRIGYVFQHLALFPHLTVAENIAFGLRDLARPEREAKVAAMLERLRIAHTAARRPDEISGGEAQRVALARALIISPRLLLLDEPMSALDAATKRALIADLKRLRTETALPIIYVTHNRDEAITLGEQLIVLEAGRVIERGEPLRVFAAPSRLTVARLAEVENIFRATVLARDEERGELKVRLTGEGQDSFLEIPLGDYAVGEEITVAIPSGDILLAASRPTGLSARNVLRGEVASVTSLGGEMRVVVNCGVPFVAAVTRVAFDELGLGQGREVWLIIKAHACYVVEGS